MIYPTYQGETWQSDRFWGDKTVDDTPDKFCWILFVLIPKCTTFLRLFTFVASIFMPVTWTIQHIKMKLGTLSDFGVKKMLTTLQQIPSSIFCLSTEIYIFMGNSNLSHKLMLVIYRVPHYIRLLYNSSKHAYSELWTANFTVLLPQCTPK